MDAFSTLLASPGSCSSCDRRKGYRSSASPTFRATSEVQRSDICWCWNRIFRKTGVDNGVRRRRAPLAERDRQSSAWCLMKKENQSCCKQIVSKETTIWLTTSRRQFIWSTATVHYCLTLLNTCCLELRWNLLLLTARWLRNISKLLGKQNDYKSEAYEA